MTLSNHPPHERWHDWTELDATAWPGGDDTCRLEVEAGTLVVFDGLLPHASAPNRSAQSRLAYSLHVVDGRTAWSPLNWLQRRADDPARIVEASRGTARAFHAGTGVEHEVAAQRRIRLALAEEVAAGPREAGLRRTLA